MLGPLGGGYVVLGTPVGGSRQGIGAEGASAKMTARAAVAGYPVVGAESIASAVTA
jgi:hypothetical protein